VNSVGDDVVTIAHPLAARCAECGRSFQRRGRARFCSQRCRQRAHRGRQAEPSVAVLAQAAVRTRSRDLSVYECPQCGERYLAEQRCQSCGVFCRSLGYGLSCPSCGDTIVLNELLAELGLPGLS
jgi:predicted RNA-binding Zn-ribbon protein involved in translation (DUF1610 family)